MIAEWISWVRFFLFRKAQKEVDEELQFHLEQSIELKKAAGLSEAEARRQALIEIGGLQQSREKCRERRPGHQLEVLAQDIRYALRGFRRDIGFTITVIATLALGVGASTSVFSTVDHILFRPLPFANGDRLVALGMVQSLEKQEFMLGGFFYDWRDKQGPFEGIASQGTMLHACDLVENNPAQLNCINAQAGFLPLLGVSPVLGRNFLPEEDRPGGPRVALISYGLWMNHYGGQATVLNRQIDIDGKPARVVGILPRNFELPSLQAPDVMFPMALNEARERQAKPGSPMRAYARLRPGVSLQMARLQMEPIFAQTRDNFLPPPIRKDFHLSVRPIREIETGDVRLTAWILLAAVIAMLLIACANVASVMMARSAAREQEFAVRSALGASRVRLIRQFLTEAAILSLAGVLLGLAVAFGLLRVFVKIAPAGIPFLHRAGIDFRVTAFAVCVTLLCALVFGIYPALHLASRSELAARSKQSRTSSSLRKSLVVAQIATSLVLLSGAGLLLRSVTNLLQQSLGIQTQNVFVVEIALPGFRYDTPQKKADFYLRLDEAVRRLPGVRAVAYTDSIPPGGWNSGYRLSDLMVEGRPALQPGTGGTVTTRVVSPDYLRALNIALIKGRNFTDADVQSDAVEVILSEFLAAKLFAGEDPLGKRVQPGHNVPWATVVGIAENVKNNGLTGPNDPEIYILRKHDEWGPRAPILIVDSVQSQKLVEPWIRLKVESIDATVPVKIDPLSKTLERLAERPQFEAVLLSFFACCGLLLAVIGLYGVISYGAVQRTQETGVRMALGATRADILRLMVGEGARLIVLGGAIGLAAALCTARFLRSILFVVGPYDLSTYCTITLLLGTVALIATIIPARRAMEVDPAIALRAD